MKKHNNKITHLDWSVESGFLQSNCAGYEIVYWDAESGKFRPDGAQFLRNEKWATWSCVLGWPVQGIFEKNSEGKELDVSMVDRSHAEFFDEYYGIATAD